MNDAREHRIESYEHAPVATWKPQLPSGRINAIYTHWSAHDYRAVFPAYHFCIAQRDDTLVVVNTHDVRENMRDIQHAPEAPYAAHTRGRNSFALGVSIMAMQDATPADFGPYPLTDMLVDALCRVVAKLATTYDVPVDAEHVMSHAEAARLDGYFGSEPEQRWDIARLHPSSRVLDISDAVSVGDELRSRTKHFQAH